MKIAACLALATLLVAGLSHAQKGGGRGGLEDCRADNRNALKPVEAQYASNASRLPKADQDRYKAMLAAIKTGGSTLSDCRAKTAKIAELKTTLAGMVAAANAPKPVKVGDKARGGVVFHVTGGGMHGLVADVADVPVMGNVMIFEAAEQACAQSTSGGQSDWYLPNSAELSQLYAQRQAVGGFQSGGRDHYWNSSRMQGQSHKLYWQRFGDGMTGWSDIENRGPNRSLHNARCIRKF